MCACTGTPTCTQCAGVTWLHLETAYRGHLFLVARSVTLSWSWRWWRYTRRKSGSSQTQGCCPPQTTSCYTCGRTPRFMLKTYYWQEYMIPSIWKGEKKYFLYWMRLEGKKDTHSRDCKFDNRQLTKPGGVERWGEGHFHFSRWKCKTNH